MRKLYLIRHGRPDLPPGVRRCIGITDVPLGTFGRLQAAVLGVYLQDRPIARVFCSDLSRAVDTARALTDRPTILADLREMAAGQWDGLYFDEIRRRWPELYEKRGTDLSIPIPGSEPLEQGQLRFRRAVEQLMEESQGDVAVVAHATVIRSFLSYAAGTDLQRYWDYPLDYTGICTLRFADGRFSLLQVNEIPRVPLTEALCLRLLDAAHGPAEHCRQVADRAEALARALNEAGQNLDVPLVRFGGLLHDLARKEPHHAEVGARWLEDLGYGAAAALVRAHNDGAPVPDERAVVFLADKLPLEERFAASLQKCKTEEARAAHGRRYETALALKDTINTLCRKEILP